MDVSSQVALVMATKEEAEVHIMKRAFQSSIDVLNKYLRDQILDIVDGEKRVRHQKLAEGVEAAVSDKKYVSGVDTTQLEPCYPPIVQSGGNYSLKFSAVTDKNYLHFGSIVCCLGARYKSYCSNVVRTYLVNPSSKQEVKNDLFLPFLVEKTISEIRSLLLYRNVTTSFAKLKKSY